MKKCSYARKYKGLRPPRCNGGEGCDTCIAIRTAAVTQKAQVIGSGQLDIVDAAGTPTSINAWSLIQRLAGELQGLTDYILKTKGQRALAAGMRRWAARRAA